MPGTSRTDPDEITDDEFERSVPLSIAELDDGFFRVRAGASTAVERTYMRAMAELGPGPVGTAEVAALLGRPVTTVSPIRDGLIKRALCYCTRARARSTSPCPCSAGT